MQLFVVIARALVGVLTATGLANAQTAAYPGGSIYDLAPPMKQATGNTYLEALVLSKRQNRMKEMRDYPANALFRKLARPVGRLAMAVQLSGGKRAISYCTVSLIADDLILTNHHCIPGNPVGKVVDARLWMGFLTTRHAKGVRQYGVDLRPVEADRRLDYAIHTVRGAPGKTWGTIDFAGKPQLYDRQALFIIHHPAGDKQHITLGDCQAGAPVTERDDLLHVCDTIAGSSGAPVFDSDTRKVVGLHYRAVEIGKLNAAKRIDRLIETSKTLQRLIKQRRSKRLKPLMGKPSKKNPELATLTLPDKAGNPNKKSHTAAGAKTTRPSKQSLGVGDGFIRPNQRFTLTTGGTVELGRDRALLAVTHTYGPNGGTVSVRLAGKSASLNPGQFVTLPRGGCRLYVLRATSRDARFKLACKDDRATPSGVEGNDIFVQSGQLFELEIGRSAELGKDGAVMAVKYTNTSNRGVVDVILGGRRKSLNPGQHISYRSRSDGRCVVSVRRVTRNSAVFRLRCRR